VSDGPRLADQTFIGVCRTGSSGIGFFAIWVGRAVSHDGAMVARLRRIIGDLYRDLTQQELKIEWKLITGPRASVLVFMSDAKAQSQSLDDLVGSFPDRTCETIDQGGRSLQRRRQVCIGSKRLRRR
jgi:hypothetical protein